MWKRPMFHRRPALHFTLFLLALAALLGVSLNLPQSASAAPVSNPPNFGPNVYIFNPSMSLSDIQATVNQIAAQQVPNEFGTQRYALLFARRS